MKKLRIYLIIMMFLLSPIKALQGMELKTKPLKRMPLLVPNSDVLLIINIENDNGQAVHSSRWSPTQLSYFSTLDKQYTFNADSMPNSDPIILPQSSITNIETFHLIEQAGALLEANHTQQNEYKKDKLKKYFAQTTEPSKLRLLLRASDFLNNQLIYDACKEHTVEITQKFVQQQRISAALSFLEQFDDHHDAIYLGNHLMASSPSITQLLIKLQKGYDIKRIKQEKHPWHCIPKQDHLFFKSTHNNDTLKFWHNNIIKTLYCKNKNYLHTAWICSNSNKVFCVFRKVIDTDNHNSVEMYDLNTGILLCSKEINSNPTCIRYCPQKNILMLIHKQMIRKYSLKTSDNTTSFVEESTFNQVGMSNFAFDTFDETIYFTINDQKIHHYDPEKNTVETCFTQSKKSRKRRLQALCISPSQRILYFSFHRKRDKNYKAANKLCFYNLNDKKIQKRIPLKCPIEKISISPDETIVAVEPSRQNKVLLLDTKFGRKLKAFNKCHFPAVFSLDSKTLVARYGQGYIEHNLLDFNMEKNLRNYPVPHIALLYSCAAILESKKGSIDNMINSSKTTQELFEQLPEKIQSYINKSYKKEKE